MLRRSRRVLIFLKKRSKTKQNKGDTLWRHINRTTFTIEESHETRRDANGKSLPRGKERGWGGGGVRTQNINSSTSETVFDQVKTEKFNCFTMSVGSKVIASSSEGKKVCKGVQTMTES